MPIETEDCGPVYYTAMLKLGQSEVTWPRTKGRLVRLVEPNPEGIDTVRYFIEVKETDFTSF